jgi:anti-anti-sigma factor
MATEWSDTIVLAQLADEPALSDELSSIIDRIGDHADRIAPHVVLDFAGVTYLASSNLAQLLRLRKHLHEAHRSLRLCSLSEPIWSVMMVTGLDKVFEFAEDTMTALASLQLQDQPNDP